MLALESDENTSPQQPPEFAWIQLMLKLGEFFRNPIRKPTGANLDERFDSFHSLNPHVYDAIVVLARHKSQMGYTRVSMRGLFELLRETRAFQTKGDPYKLNNSYTPHYSRLLAIEEPQLGRLFERRESMKAPLGEGDNVNYWAGLRRGNPTGTAKVTKLGDMSGTPVAWLEGVNGCIAATHLERLQHGAQR